MAAVEEERFTSVKHDNNFPNNAINYCLKEAGITPEKLDFVVFYEKPFQKFERILQTCTETYPESFKMFRESFPQWILEKLRMPGVIKKKLDYKGKILFITHHKSHAASAFFASPFEEATIVTIDAVGEWVTTAIHYGNGNEIKTLKEIKFPNSLGLFYSSITSYLGFKVLNDEYKVMGLAGWGKPVYLDKFKNLIRVKGDGSFNLNTKYFPYTHEHKMFNEKLEKLFRKPARRPDEKIEKFHMDVASSLQAITEDIVLKIVRYAKKLTGSKNLCMSGGVTLNSVVNGRIISDRIFENCFFQPASTDAGGALGAALFAFNSILGNKRKYVMKHAFLGPEFDSETIKKFLESNNIEYEKLSIKEIIGSTAEKIAKDKVIGWFQGRMEFGPRALGNRSILANPRNPKMKDILNEKVKKREWFRPFAPSLDIDFVERYFNVSQDFPFMIVTLPVNKTKAKEIVEEQK